MLKYRIWKLENPFMYNIGDRLYNSDSSYYGTIVKRSTTSEQIFESIAYKNKYLLFDGNSSTKKEEFELSIYTNKGIE